MKKISIILAIAALSACAPPEIVEKEKQMRVTTSSYFIECIDHVQYWNRHAGHSEVLTPRLKLVLNDQLRGYSC